MDESNVETTKQGTDEALQLKAEFFDVEFRIPNDDGGFCSVKTFKSHLATASPVFYTQFFGAMREQQDPPNNTCEVVQVKVYS